MNTKLKKAPTPTAMVCEITRLKSQQHFLEKSQNFIAPRLTENDKIEKDLVKEIELLEANNAEKFIAFKSDIQTETKSLLNDIADFKEKILRDNLKNMDIILYRNRVIEMNNNIANLIKTLNMKLETLKTEFIDINGSIPEVPDFLQDVPKYFVTHKKIMKKAISEPILNEDLKEFEKFLEENGGHTGGWNDQQHNLYQRLKMIYKTNLTRITDVLKKDFPHVTLEEVKNHDTWFINYLLISNKRKTVFNGWKNN